MSTDEPKWGASHTLALALVALDLNVVHRATLRALLPAGRVQPGKLHDDRTGGRNVIRRMNGLDGASRHLIELGARADESMRVQADSSNAMSEIFKKALKRFEVNEWITRGSVYVLVRDKRSLLDWATSARQPESFTLDLIAATQRIKDDLEDLDLTAKALEQRRKELLAIQRLMEQGYGSRNWSGRGSVRFLPRSRTL